MTKDLALTASARMTTMTGEGPAVVAGWLIWEMSDSIQRAEGVMHDASAASRLALLGTAFWGHAKAKDHEIAPHPTLYGFTMYPYSISPEAFDKTHELALPISTLCHVHFDECKLPWYETLYDKPLPAWLEAEWRDRRRRIPESLALSLAVTPTTYDRQTISPAYGATENETLPLPEELHGASYDDPKLIKAFANYTLRAIKVFNPTYLLLSIEMSELSLRAPDKWLAFERFYMQTFETIKGKYPDLKICIELMLQSLMLERVAEQVRPVVEMSDFIGISFYPYMDEFGVHFGAPALPEPPDQWRQPLDWLRSYTQKPIAMTETGYTTKNQVVSGLHFNGTPELQKAYLEDLVAIAKRDRYLFVTWFVSIDFDRRYEERETMMDAGRIWVNAGLRDRDLRDKPAFEVWKAAVEASRREK